MDHAMNGGGFLIGFIGGTTAVAAAVWLLLRLL